MKHVRVEYCQDDIGAWFGIYHPYGCDIEETQIPIPSQDEIDPDTKFYFTRKGWHVAKDELRQIFQMVKNDGYTLRIVRHNLQDRIDYHDEYQVTAVFDEQDFKNRQIVDEYKRACYEKELQNLKGE